MSNITKINKSNNNINVPQENTMAMILCHFCATCEAQNANIAITLKISSENTLVITNSVKFMQQ